jgi:hypothetical protein
MMSDDAAGFIGTIPQHYDQGLGPIIFVDYAADIARRVASGGSTFWPRPYGPRQELQHDLAELLRRLFEHRMRGAGNHCGPRIRNLACAHSP